MRVLRVGTSHDFSASIAEEQRGWAIAEQMLGEASGQPVETILKRAWPTAEFAGAVERWMKELEPDFVLFQVNNFWYGHDSVALWFQRRFGRVGAKMTELGLRVGDSKVRTEHRWGQFINRSLLRVLPGDTHFTVPQVAQAMEAAMRKVLAREGAVLLIRGNDHYEKLPMATKRQNRRNGTRNAAMSDAMRAVCERLRVPYCELPAIRADELGEFLGKAQWHHGVDGERRSGEFDGQQMVAAWRAAQTGTGAGRAAVELS